MKVILFDIDGTLLLTGGVGVKAFNRVFGEMFDCGDVWGSYDPHGKTDSMIIDELSQMALGRAVNAIEKIEISRRYVMYFEEYIESTSGFRLMPGVVRLLEELENRKHLLGIATGNYKRPAELKLKRGKLDRYFSFLGSGSDSHQRLEMTRCALKRGIQKAGGTVNKNDVVLIGDSFADVECAQALGLKCIAVATGTRTLAELSDLNPELALEDLNDTQKVTEFIETS